MQRRLRTRFWIELALGLISAALLVITLIWNDWIELVFHVDPDASSGAAERTVVAIALFLTVLFLVLARMEWRRTALEGRLTLRI